MGAESKVATKTGAGAGLPTAIKSKNGMGNAFMARMIVGFVLSTFVLLAGCAGPQYSNVDKIQAALESSGTGVDQYIIGPTDTLSVSVWRNPDLSMSVPVRPDGKISVPLVGDVQASGKTPEQLADDITASLAKYIREPEVSIIVTNMGSHEFTHRVRVTGAVSQQISVPYRKGMTVLDMVLSAGGPTPFASLNDSVLYRHFKGEVVAIPIKLEDILKEGRIRTNYALQPGDIITIPERML
ncbi:polysaccharide export protein [Marinobacteraceae bacterium S3BR75-40.1]